LGRLVVALALTLAVRLLHAAPFSCPYCDLRNAKLAGRDLTNANLLGADLRDADLRGATLRGAALAGANLTGADLRDANLGASDRPANLTLANLTDARLAGASLGEAIANFAQGLPPKAPRPARNDPKYFCGAKDTSALANVVYVAKDGTDGAACGRSRTSPCATIQRGITNCGGPDCAVLVAYDMYELQTTVALRSGVAVYGGCDLLPAPDPALQSVLLAPEDGAVAVLASGLASPTAFQGFAIFGGRGAATSTLVVSSGGSGLTLELVMLIGGEGGTGAKGAPGVRGRDGGSARTRLGGISPCRTPAAGGSDGDGVSIREGFPVGCDSYSPSGTAGEPGSTGFRAPGGGGGTVTCSVYDPNGSKPAPPRGGPGERGTGGKQGPCGGPGKASPELLGSVVAGVWKPGAGGSGEDGGDGGGGGAGGTGGNCGVSNFIAPFRSSFGGSGAGGGGGGCGGTGGKGGEQGGASIALLVNGGSVALRSVTIVGGKGGRGGAGGQPSGGGLPGSAGARGYSYQNPATPPCPNTMWGGDGGYGGLGGCGGTGAGGAGGNGGPAFGVVTAAGGTLIPGPPTLYTGTGGTPGEPDKSTRLTCECFNPDSEKGLPGTAADLQAF
jgi:hypothetical protein